MKKGDIESAKREQEKLTPLREAADVVFLDTIYYPASMLLDIADSLVLGEIAWSRGDGEEALERFRHAVDVQDQLPYTEPPFWYYPTRHTLGKALLESGNAEEAEAVYQRDLELYPHNGWAMFGLIQALKAQGKDASATEAKFAIAWAAADVELTASQF